MARRGRIGLSDRAQTIGAVTYRTRELGGRYLTEKREGDTWTPGSSFDTTPHRLDDLSARSRSHPTAPDSPFTRRPRARWSATTAT